MQLIACAERKPPRHRLNALAVARTGLRAVRRYRRPCAEHPFRQLHSANEALCDRAIVCCTRGQQDGDKAPFNIRECVNLRVAASARAANSLLLLPPPPPADRA